MPSDRFGATMTTTSTIPPKTSRRRSLGRFAFVPVALLLATAAVAAPPKRAQVSEDGTKIATPIASFSGLDKITGRIISFDVAIDETVQFGALQVTPRVCYTRPQTMAPLTTTFVEVDEITLENKIRRIFTGWMFADSPGLHAVEHPVYDVWLTDCKMSTDDPAARAKAGIPASPPIEGGAAETTPVTPATPTPPAKPAAKPQPTAAEKPAAPRPPAPKADAAAPPAGAARPTGGAPLPTRSELPPLR
jgi:hypothetical protein